MAEGVKYDALLLQGYGFLVPVLGSRFSVSLNISPFSSSMQLSRLVCSAHLSSLLCMLIFSSLSVSNVSSSSFNLPFVHSPLPSFTSLSLIHIISIVVYSFVVFPPSQSSLYHPLVSFVSFCSISLKSYPLPFPIILVYSRFLFVQIAFPVFPAFVLQLEFVIFGL